MKKFPLTNGPILRIWSRDVPVPEPGLDSRIRELYNETFPGLVGFNSLGGTSTQRLSLASESSVPENFPGQNFRGV